MSKRLPADMKRNGKECASVAPFDFNNDHNGAAATSFPFPTCIVEATKTVVSIIDASFDAGIVVKENGNVVYYANKTVKTNCCRYRTGTDYLQWVPGRNFIDNHVVILK